jgi:fructokinase
MQIGVDLGGTKIEGIGLEGQTVVAARRRVTTPHDYRATIEAIARLVWDIEDEAGRTGSVGLVKNANSVWLTGHPLAANLEARLSRPVRVTNDANCFTLSESVDGAGAGFETVFGVILGTGVGAGISFQQHVHEGANQIAGEWGHTPLPWTTDAERASAARCYCGRYGCVETFLSGPGFERDYRLHSRTQLSSHEIVRAAGDLEPHAVDAIQRYQDRLARGLAAVINVLDPDVIVLGGGMSNLPSLPAAISAKLPDHVFSDSVVTRVVLNAHGASSGVRGAAWLWSSRLHAGEK